MAADTEFWIPLVDEPIGRIVGQLEDEDAEIRQLVSNSPRKLLAFRTFAYIRVGLLLGQVLVDSDVPADGGETWVDALMRDPANAARVRAEVKAVAEQVASDSAYGDGDGAEPDDDVRARFREFARRRLG